MSTFESIAKFVQEGSPIAGDLGHLLHGVGGHDGIIHVRILATISEGVGHPMAALDGAPLRVGDAEATTRTLLLHIL